MKNQDIIQQVVPVFKVESAKHIATIRRTLVELSQHPQKERESILLEKIGHSIHTLIGAARGVEYFQVAEISEQINRIVNRLKNEDISLSTDVFSLLDQGLDAMHSIINTDQHQKKATVVKSLLNRLEKITSTSLWKK